MFGHLWLLFVFFRIFAPFWIFTGLLLQGSFLASLGFPWPYSLVHTSYILSRPFLLSCHICGLGRFWDYIYLSPPTVLLTVPSGYTSFILHLPACLLGPRPSTRRIYALFI